MAELDDHVRRILRSEFASGIVDYPRKKSVVDVEGGLETCAPDRRAKHGSAQEQQVACCRSIPQRCSSIAIIGPHADIGMISGGGSAQVDPPGRAGTPVAGARVVSYFAVEGGECESSQRQACNSIRERIRPRRPPGAKADVAIVFAYQWRARGTGFAQLCRCPRIRTR